MKLKFKEMGTLPDLYETFVWVFQLSDTSSKRLPNLVLKKKKNLQ